MEIACSWLQKSTSLAWQRDVQHSGKSSDTRKVLVFVWNRLNKTGLKDGIFTCVGSV